VMNLNLNFTGVNNGYELYQNVPNPFVKSTVVGFNLPSSMRGKLTVYDVTGKVLKVVEQTFNKGNNQVTLTRSELAASGILYYTLETADYTATKKMIILE
ncbi:MAG: T9SS type A sorting domain-containing protein, partial [Saprospiraceae bacterium]